MEKPIVGKLLPDLRWTSQRSRAACCRPSKRSQGGMPDGHGPPFSSVSSCLVGFISKRNQPSTISLILEKWEVPSLLRLGDLGGAGKYLPATVVSLYLSIMGRCRFRCRTRSQLPTPGAQLLRCNSLLFLPEEGRTSLRVFLPLPF